MAAGVAPASLRNMRSLLRYPKSDACIKMAKFLGTNVEYLMTGRAEEETPARLDVIINRLQNASDLELAMIEKILDVGGKT